MISDFILKSAMEKLNYSPDSGVFTWKSKWGKRDAGAVAGSKANTGYLTVDIKDEDGVFKRVLLHRLAYAFENGPFNGGEVDHYNHNRLDNRIKNLRLVSHKENKRNNTIQSNNTSGVNGVTFDKNRNKWMARIVVDGVTKYLGRFDNIDDAVTARTAANGMYGFHKNHGGQKQ